MIGVLAAFTLFAFLRNWKITVIVVALVPIVMPRRSCMLDVFGKGFNIMTLGGMVIAVGLVIDDAIVMIEQPSARSHARRRRAQVPRPRDGGGARIHWLSLAGSSAATLIIFVPLAFLSGVTGANASRRSR